MAKVSGTRFDHPVEVFETRKLVEETDSEPEYSVYCTQAMGVSSRAPSYVFDASGEQIGYLGDVYVYDALIVAELQTIATTYHAMHRLLQKQWKEALEKATLVGGTTA